MAAKQKDGQKNFLAGMNPDTADLKLNEDIGEIQFSSNMLVSKTPGALDPIYGSQFFNSVQGAADLTSTINKTMKRFYKSSGGAFTMVSWDSGAVKGLSTINATTEVLIDNTLTKTITDYEVFNDKVFMVNGTNSLFIWDGIAAGLTTVVFPIAFAPTILSMYKGRMHYAGDANFPSRVIFSEPRQPEVFEVPFLSDQDVFDDDGDVIRALIAYGDDLYIFKERRFYRWRGVPVREIIPSSLEGIGCINKDTIAVTRFGIIFLSKLGVYSVSTQSVKHISVILSPALMRGILNRNENDFSGVMNKGIYYLFFRSATSTTIQEGLTFDFNAVEYGTTFPSVGAIQNFPIQNSEVFLGANDSEEWIGLMSGTNNVIRVDGPSPSYYQNIANPATPLSYIISTKWEDGGAPWRRDEIRRIYLYFHEPFVSINVRLVTEENGKSNGIDFTQSYDESQSLASGDVTLWDDNTTIWDTAIWDGQSTFMTYIDMPTGVYGERWKIELSSNDVSSPLTLDGYEVSFTVGPELI